ncbi:hypothetical protein ACHAXH_008604 [Discostella pseudostelligera]
MNRLLTTASRAAGACRSGSVGIINHHHHKVVVAAFSTTIINSSSSTIAPTSAQRYFVVRHFADTSSSSSSSSADDDTTTSATGTTNNNDDSNNTNPNDDSSDIQRGTVKLFNTRNGWGFIIPDGVDKRKHKEEELVFIHRVDIKTRNALGAGEKGYFPSLIAGQRVQFKVGPPANDKASSGKAYDLTNEGGGLVAPFQPGYLDGFISKQKAMFGDEVYDIFSTSKDQKELEMRIVAAYERVKGNIERQRARVERFSEKIDE